MYRPRCVYLQLSGGSFESKHNYLMLLSLFKLTTCFGPCTGPSSGHKIYNIVSSVIGLVTVRLPNARAETLGQIEDNNIRLLCFDSKEPLFTRCR